MPLDDFDNPSHENVVPLNPARQKSSINGQQKKLKELYMSGKSPFASNLANAILALQTEPELRGRFGYNEMTRVVTFKKSPQHAAEPITDGDEAALQKWLQTFGFRKLGGDTVHQAVAFVAHQNCFHPVRDYLRILTWDGIDRLDSWLHVYLGAENTQYNAGIGRMFLIGMVARIMRPGCKHNYMMILEGEQGMLKSTACSILAGQYFTDNLPDVTNKESSQHLRGKWLIEVAELRAYSRAAVDHFKEFLTRDTERYRPPWGRNEVHEPRQCVFVGTTNKELYLRDETGNRRFWPVKVGKIDLENLALHRNQLFAEAVHRFNENEHWWPDRQFECNTIAAEQDARYEADAWEGPIKDYLDHLHDPKTTVLKIALGALDFEGSRPLIVPNEPSPARGTPINRLGTADQRRIAAILTHLGWVPKRSSSERWWEKR